MLLRALAACCLTGACAPNERPTPDVPSGPPRKGNAPEGPEASGDATTTAAAGSPKNTLPGAASGGKLRVLCIGAHPDDPETGCGGTLARYAEAGHIVNVLYLTKGENGIEGKSPSETGAIRAAEAVEACRALGVNPLFFGQPAGTIAFNPQTSKALAERIDQIGADIIFGQWPIDTNYDHQATSMLTLSAYLAKSRQHPLYLYEVEAGTQTLGFTPHAFVEIGPVLQKKLAAIRAHKSQDAERRLYERHHEPMERFRAREIGGTAAEAFAVLAPEVAMTHLPGL